MTTSPAPPGCPSPPSRTCSTAGPGPSPRSAAGGCCGPSPSSSYRPNAIARSLRARRTRILGFVLPDSANPYFAALAHAIEEAAAARGYQVIVANAAERPEREAAHIEALLRLQVDGLFWIPADLRRAGRVAPHAREVPTVQIDRTLDPPPRCRRRCGAAAGRAAGVRRGHGGQRRRRAPGRRRTCWRSATGAWPASPARPATATPRPGCRVPRTALRAAGADGATAG